MRTVGLEGIRQGLAIRSNFYGGFRQDTQVPLKYRSDRVVFLCLQAPYLRWIRVRVYRTTDNKYVSTLSSFYQSHTASCFFSNIYIAVIK